MVAESEKKKLRKEIPAYLVREEFGGQKWYYKGYKEVLNNNKKAAAIMGSSSLQSILVMMVSGYLYNLLNRKKYRIASNEAGLHIAKNENLANDIAVYYKEDAQATDKYFDKPPRLVIEVDVKIDDDERTDMSEYVVKKSQLMLDFGVERVIWITTATKKVYVISKNERWVIVNFDETVPLFDDHTLNVAELLKEEDLEL